MIGIGILYQTPRQRGSAIGPFPFQVGETGDGALRKGLLVQPGWLQPGPDRVWQPAQELQFLQDAHILFDLDGHPRAVLVQITDPLPVQIPAIQ